MSLSRFNKGVVGSYDATKDQRNLRQSRSVLLGALKRRAETTRAKLRRAAVNRRIEGQIQAAAIRENARRDRNV